MENRPANDKFKKEACYACKGTGEIKVESHMDGKTEFLTLGCVTCNGAKTLPIGARAAFDAFWCNCKEGEFGDWHEDGVCPDCSKHHAHCRKCLKILQVG